MDAAMQAEKRLYPECEVEPAGIFYYNVKDPMIQKTLQEDLDELDPGDHEKTEDEWAGIL